ncbi:DUF4238 domain-containing protein [Flavobacterium sufflavum]|uniref:DUF4238 domain-containing protein n=1 Tax=Flavobacterium sufflavum TaxID=1921138 RepID=A0A3S2V1C3_9FLAO|nr:DUF4238 domain-containing protein [Flavobacterium sufflavum]RVT72733.1 DUF4238 domain-containing protein [Flavobacterium sufflavum]
MKNPKKQNQHKLPQVYLREFGYDFKGQKKVSVLKVGEKFTRQKSIESFLSETNVFKIKSINPELENIFEELNGLLENEYLNFISDLDNNHSLSDKSYAVLLQLIPNLLCRTDEIRDLISYLLNSDAKINFLKIICIHRAQNIEDLIEKDFYKIMVVQSVNDNVINRALIFLMEHIFRRIAHYDIVILQSQEDKPWFTTDNPIIFENRMENFEIMLNESEIYFPLSPKYLIYLHHRESKDKVNELRQLEKNKIHLVNDKQNVNLQYKIMKNAIEYVIIEGEFKYTIGENIDDIK